MPYTHFSGGRPHTFTVDPGRQVAITLSSDAVATLQRLNDSAGAPAEAPVALTAATTVTGDVLTIARYALAVSAGSVTVGDPVEATSTQSPVSWDSNPLLRRTPKWGIIGSRLSTPHVIDTSVKYASTKTWIPIPGGFSGPVIAFFTNGFMQGGTNFGGSGAAMTLTSAMQFVDNTRVQLTFGGNATATIPDATAAYPCDQFSINVSAQDGGLWSNIWLYNPAGVPQIRSAIGESTLGDGAAFSSTALPDLTMSGTQGFSSGYGYRLVALIGLGRRKAVLYLDDSIGKGQGPATDSLGHNGIIERVLGQQMPGVNCSSPGTYAQYLSGMTAAAGYGVLWQYCDIACIGAGTNDIFLGGRTAAQVIGDTATLAGKLAAAGLRVYDRTILPQTTSTDFWATLANQTVKAQEQVRLDTNDQKRGLLAAGVSGVFDVTTDVEVNGKWRPYMGGNGVNGGDGTHPQTPAAEAVRHSGRVSIAAVTR